MRYRSWFGIMSDCICQVFETTPFSVWGYRWSFFCVAERLNQGSIGRPQRQPVGESHIFILHSYIFTTFCPLQYLVKSRKCFLFMLLPHFHNLVLFVTRVWVRTRKLWKRISILGFFQSAIKPSSCLDLQVSNRGSILESFISDFSSQNLAHGRPGTGL